MTIRFVSLLGAVALITAAISACNKQDRPPSSSPSPSPAAANSSPAAPRAPDTHPGGDSGRPRGALTAGWDEAAILAAKTRTKGNLEQIAHACLNFHITFPAFPAGIYDKSGKKLILSWRVALLPFLEEEEFKLYRQFRLDEPWDSDHNKKLIEKMPSVFAPPKGTNTPAGRTFLRGFNGPGTIFQPLSSASVKGDSRTDKFIALGKKLANPSFDGGNQLLVAEVADPVEWTRPDELVYEPSAPLPKFGGVFADGFFAVMADEYVKFFKPETDEKTLRGLITGTGPMATRLP